MKHRLYCPRDGRQVAIGATHSHASPDELPLKVAPGTLIAVLSTG